MKTVRLILGMVFVLLLFLFSAASMRAQDKFEVFGGYSYFRASVTETGQPLCPPAGPPCPPMVTVTSHPSLNGWEASAEYKPVKEVGLVADFGGNYGSLPNSSGGGSLHTNTYLFGPRVFLPGRISPFVHVLAGAAHQSTGDGGAGGAIFVARSTNAFAIALGGGVDIDVTQRVRMRLVQFDYVGANSGLSFRNQARISAGLVFHF